MWFITGIVLIYHPYPKVSEKLLYDNKENLPSSLPDLSSVRSRMDDKVKSLSLKQFQGQTLFSTDKAPSVTFPIVERVAKHWINAPIERVDTLNEREQWVLFTKYDKELPIYKFYFDDAERHELFISGRTAEVLQMTTAKQRFWAWMVLYLINYMCLVSVGMWMYGRTPLP